MPKTGLYTRRALAVLGCAVMLGLSACSPPEPILKGTRISVLPEIQLEAVSQEAQAEGAGLPAIVNINAAPMQGLSAGHEGGNPRLEAPLTEAWRANIGGVGSELADLAQPVVGDGRVYTVAPNGVVAAFDVRDGGQIWSVRIEDIEDDPLPGIGGGLALSREGLVVHAGGNRLALLTPSDGSIIWEITVDIPFRGSPTIIGSDRVAATDLDGNMRVMTLVSGERIWQHFGIASNTVLFGTPAPAFANDEIVLAGAAGEVAYFDAASGELLWTDSVASLLPRTAIQGLGDVRATPVHDGGLIFVISQSGRLVAFSARNGLPVWERAIGGIEMPWVAGESIFVLSLDGRLYALRRSDGAVRWIAELDGAVSLDVVVPEKPPRYVGPIVAGDKVYVVSRAGLVQAFDADTGAAGDPFSTGQSTLTSPQIAGGRMFLLGQNGTLIAVE
ncbi:MAG: PQQ-binding-like beta-propeller repeat protein [Candidatus Puniceispirillaceae bacterium]